MKTPLSIIAAAFLANGPEVWAQAALAEAGKVPLQNVGRQVAGDAPSMDDVKVARVGHLSGQIRDLAAPFEAKPANVQSGQSRIIFYRPHATSPVSKADEGDNDRASTNEPSDAKAGPNAVKAQSGVMTVFVNGDYQASLKSGAYSELCLPPGRIEVGVSHVDVSRKPGARRLVSTIAMPLQDAQTQYVRVQGRIRPDGVPELALTSVNSGEALRELAATRLQVHTISRVQQSQPCQMVEEELARTREAEDADRKKNGLSQPVAPATITVTCDCLFEYGSAGRAGLTEESVTSLARLQSQLREHYKDIEHIHLIGFADPLGNPLRNEELARERARTVKEFLEADEQLRGRITMEGRGSTDLLVSHCPKAITAESIACNQPNRRVVLQVKSNPK